jgi:hypothetical protein
MPASHRDSYVLSTDTTLQYRVRSALLAVCVSINYEDHNTPFHSERASFAAQAINAADTYKELFTNSLGIDADCLADATAGGTVVLTPSNVAAQAALVTDAHIDAAVAYQFNSFFRTPGS